METARESPTGMAERQSETIEDTIQPFLRARIQQRLIDTENCLSGTTRKPMSKTEIKTGLGPRVMGLSPLYQTDGKAGAVCTEGHHGRTYPRHVITRGDYSI